MTFSLKLCACLSGKSEPVHESVRQHIGKCCVLYILLMRVVHSLRSVEPSSSARTPVLLAVW